MAYTNNNGGNKRYNNNRQQAPRPKKMQMNVPLVQAFYVTNRQGETTEIDRNAVLAALEDLNNNDVFSILTTNITMDRALILGDDSKRGTMTVGFINGFNIDIDDNITVDVTIYATSVENVNRLLNDGVKLHLVPRINAYNGEFRSFTGFMLEII